MRFDLASIREETAVLFAAWDSAIANGQFALAKDVRQHRLWPLVRARLHDDALGYPGIYAFLANQNRDGWGCINYIGQSERNLRIRLDDYVKDDSCWDAGLVDNVDLIEEVGFNRLRPVMPSREETLRAHVAKHASTSRKARGCSLFVAGFEPEEREFILPAEAALIALAWSRGAPLENDKVQRLPSVHQRRRVLDICRQMIEGWSECGLNVPLQLAANEAIEHASGAGYVGHL